MTSAVLASRNEPCWGEPKVYVRRYPNTTSTTTVAAESNNNNNNSNKPNYTNTLFKCKPNPNPNKRSRAHDPSCNVHFKGTLPAVTGDLASSKRKLTGSNEAKETSSARYVTYNLGAYTRQELKDLKKRFLSDLERVRILQSWIENSSFDALPVYPANRRPSLPLPPPVQLPCTASDPQIPSINRTPRGRKKGRGSKRANSFSNPKEKRVAANMPADNAMKRCGQMLTRLMKDKHGWVFSAPVDVVLLRLDDYLDVIKKPMDLGTVKSNLKMNFYKSPQAFADDVRLTFNNALKYNPKGHGVYVMAETLLGKFNQMFDKMFQQQQHISATQEAALAKPKLRVMSLEEKRVLGRSLVELPQEKMVELLGIIKKRNYDFDCHGNEIELDIDLLDNDTLWELVRFVDNYKKEVGKSKTEQELVCSQVQIPVAAVIHSEMMVIERSKKMEVIGDEDVDIGEEIPAQNYPPVVIERDVSSSSSSSSSRSGSGSGSGSSSESESDVDGVQLPFVEPKDTHET